MSTLTPAQLCDEIDAAFKRGRYHVSFDIVRPRGRRLDEQTLTIAGAALRCVVRAMEELRCDRFTYAYPHDFRDQRARLEQWLAGCIEQGASLELVNAQ